jgi:hypothetical protein
MILPVAGDAGYERLERYAAVKSAKIATAHMTAAAASCHRRAGLPEVDSTAVKEEAGTDVSDPGWASGVAPAEIALGKATRDAKAIVSPSTTTGAMNL